MLPLSLLCVLFLFTLTKTFLWMHKLVSTVNLTMIACRFSIVLLCVIKLLTRSHFKLFFLINVFKIASCGNWLLAVSWHAVQYLRQTVIIYCKDQHSSQCCNWKLYWSCKYSSLFTAVTEGWGGFLFFHIWPTTDIIRLAYCQGEVQFHKRPQNYQ